MVSKAWDLSLCAAGALATLGLMLLGGVPAALRAPVALPVALVASGWAFAAVLRPRPRLPFHEQLLFALALSLSLAVLGGVILNNTPWGLRATPWAAYEVGITLLCCALALWRGYRRQGWPGNGLRLRRRDGVLIAAALVIAGAAFVHARSTAFDHGTTFTSLSLAPVAGSNGSAALLQVENQEDHAETYEVRLELGGVTLQEWSGIALAPGRSWQTRLAVPPQSGTPQPINAYLYRAEAPGTPYRSVSLAPVAESPSVALTKPADAR